MVSMLASSAIDRLGEDFKKQHPGVSFDSEVFKAVLDQVGSLVNLGTEVKKTFFLKVV
jgi:hypothetical protein